MTSPVKPRPGTLAARAAATAKVLAKFRTRPFDWATANCWKLTAAQARAMGHRFPPVPRFRSALGAKRELLATGAATTAEFLDRHFPRLPSPAMALVGDLVLLPDGPDGQVLLGAVCIADGQGNLFGWHDADASGMAAIKFAMADAVGAWRL